MYCPKCGAIIFESDNYCPACGKKITINESRAEQLQGEAWVPESINYSTSTSDSGGGKNGKSKPKKYRNKRSVATIVWLIILLCAVLAVVIAIASSDCTNSPEEPHSPDSIVSTSTTELETTATTTTTTTTTTTATTSTTTTTTTTTIATTTTGTTAPPTTTTSTKPSTTDSTAQQAQLIRDQLLDGKWKTTISGMNATIDFDDDGTAELTLRQMLLSYKTEAKYNVSDDCVIEFSFSYGDRNIRFLGGISRVSDTIIKLDGGSDGIMYLDKA